VSLAQTALQQTTNGSSTKSSSSKNPLQGVRKSYVNCRFGQLHYRSVQQQQPTKPALVCLHHSPSSSHIFEAFMAEMAADRIVYAPDTPGYGESDAPPTVPYIDDYAAAVGDMLDAFSSLQSCDVLGYHTGAAMAIELAITRPQQVRKLVLVGLPCFNGEEQKAFSAKPWPRPVREDGSHLTEEWQRSVQWRGKGQTNEMLARNFAAKLRAGDKAWWGARAAIYYKTLERLPLVKQPILVVRPKDDLWDISPRARAVLASARWKDMPQYGFGIFEVAPREMAGLVRDFCG
jgi:pimeloyl-ACP methyl ester carboxylesterase